MINPVLINIQFEMKKRHPRVWDNGLAQRRTHHNTESLSHLYSINLINFSEFDPNR